MHTSTASNHVSSTMSYFKIIFETLDSISSSSQQEGIGVQTRAFPRTHSESHGVLHEVFHLLDKKKGKSCLAGSLCYSAFSSLAPTVRPKWPDLKCGRTLLCQPRSLTFSFSVPVAKDKEEMKKQKNNNNKWVKDEVSS